MIVSICEVSATGSQREREKVVDGGGSGESEHRRSRSPKGLEK